MYLLASISPILLKNAETQKKTAAIFETTVSNAFSWMKIDEFQLRFIFFHKDPSNNIPALVQTMACRRPGGKTLSEAMMVSLLTHICVTRPQCVDKMAANVRITYHFTFCKEIVALVVKLHLNLF